MDTAAAILAGGNNLRMGRKNKAFLEIDGQSFLERTISSLRPFCDEIMIVGQDEETYGAYGLPVHQDIRPGSGSLGGIHTALLRASAPATLCVACDMPFLQRGVIARLLDLAGEGWDAVVPRLPEGLEPLCAVYSRRLVPSVEKLLDGKERRIRALLDSARVRFVEAEELRLDDPRLLTFLNVNTPGDMEKALGIPGETGT